MLRARWSKPVLCLFLMLPLAVCLAASGDHTPPVRVGLENLSLAAISSDKVQLNVTLGITSSRDVTLREIAFDRLRVNGVPFYASPLSGRLALLANRKVVPPKPLLLTAYLRDLEDFQPLRTLVADEKVFVTGIAYADVGLNPLTKVLLFTGRARVPVSIDETVAVTVPGGAAGRRAALALVETTAAAWKSVDGTWQTTAKHFSQWRRLLWDQYGPALVLAYATYKLQDDAGNVVDLDATACGFRLNGKQVIVPKAVLQPWKFDPYITAGMKHNPALKVTGYDLWLWPANAPVRGGSNQLAPAAAWRLSAKQLRLLPFTKDETEKLVVPVDGGSPVKISVHRRTGASALALVEITDPAVPAADITLHDSTADPHLDSLALFRFPAGADGRDARPDLLFVSGSRSGARLQLTTMIDSTGWGSPVISPEGVVGIVVAEQVTVPIAEVERVLGLKSNRAVAGEKP